MVEGKKQLLHVVFCPLHMHDGLSPLFPLLSSPLLSSPLLSSPLHLLTHSIRVHGISNDIKIY